MALGACETRPTRDVHIDSECQEVHPLLVTSHKDVQSYARCDVADFGGGPGLTCLDRDRAIYVPLLKHQLCDDQRNFGSYLELTAICTEASRTVATAAFSKHRALSPSISMKMTCFCNSVIRVCGRLARV